MKVICEKLVKSILTVLLCGILLCGCGGEELLPEGIGAGEGFVPADGSGEISDSEADFAGESDSTSEQGNGGDSGLPSEPVFSEESGQPPEAASESASEPLPEVTLVMVGDVLLHTPVAESGRTEEGGYDFTEVFANVKEEIAGADLALVNQEVIIGGTELGISGYPAFNAPYELGDALVDTGFDVILHATNHTLDKGKRGVLNCLAFWEESYPEEAVLGIHKTEEDSEEIYVYEQEGIRIAILNYTYGTNGIALPQDMPFAVDLLEEERVVRDLQAAEELADFTIVCPHWGTEYTLTQTKEQERWAELFAENGADLVIGTHPHVIEPVEWVEDTLVYYSLGNFVNWTSGTGEGVANRMVGGMAQVTIGRKEDGEVCIVDWGVEPLVCHVEQGFGGVTVYPLKEYNAELSERNEIVKQDSDFSLDYCLELVERVFGDAL